MPDIDAPNDNRCTGVQAPSDLAVQVSPDGVAITWVGSVTGAYVYVVQRRGSDGGIWGEIGRVAAGGSEYFDGGCVEANSACEYRVIAASSSCQTAPSALATAHTLPVAVAGFAAAGDGELARLAWQANNLYASGYVIERSDEGGAYIEITTVDGAAVGYDDAIRRNAEFCYRLSAVTDAGRGPAAESCTRGGAESVTLQAERYLDRVTLRWSDANRFETGYAILRDGAVIVQLAPDAVQLDDGVTDLALHVYEVVATSATGDSAPASVTSGRLRSDVVSEGPPAVSGCELTARATFAQQAGAPLDFVEAALEPTTNEQVTAADDFAVTGLITQRGVGVFEALWAPTYVNGSSFEVVFEHRLAFQSLTQLVATPVLASGAKTGEGLQPWPTDVALDETACGASGLGRLASIDASEDHTCVVTNAERIVCWGKGIHGQLGPATGLASAASPRVVCHELGSGPGCNGPYFLRRGDNVRIAVGYHVSYAIADNGVVRRWGTEPTRAAEPIPRVHPNLDGAAPGFSVVTMAAGNDSACAVTTGGGAVCWGLNDTGQLGRGGSPTSFDAPAAEVCTGSPCVPLTGVGSIGMGEFHACAVTAGAVYCWGDNGSGQVGTGSAGGVVTSAAQLGGSLGEAKQVALGTDFSCGLFGDNVYCWGSRAHGAIGDDGAMTGNALTPVAVSSVAGGAMLEDVLAIAAGEHHACALQYDGDLVCWGANGSGQLGDGGTADAPRPRRVRAVGSAAEDLTRVAAVAAGRAHTCAVLADASIACWGANDIGQLGNGTTGAGASSVPALVLCDGLEPSCGSAGPMYRAALRGRGTLRAIQ